MTIGSLFSGIGGLELGFERAGLGPVIWQCEIDPFCRGVLAKHWPDAVRLEDVRTLGRSTVVPVDLVCGGFPCQDVSLAGRGAGIAEGTRSGLWIEFARILEELRPSIVVVENVPGLRNRGLRRVLADLAALGFDASWTTLGAYEVGAPHRRDRLFIVAADPDRVDIRDIAERIEVRRNDVRASWETIACDVGSEGASPDSEGERSRALGADSDAACDGTDRERSSDARAVCDRWDASDAVCSGPQRPIDVAGEKLSHAPGSRDPRTAPDSAIPRLEGAELSGIPREEGRIGSSFGGSARDEGHGGWLRDANGAWLPPVSPIRRVGDGIPNRSHGRRLKALGNAVVPQCAELIGLAIVDALEAKGAKP